MKTLSILVAVSALVLATGCASRANVTVPVTTPSSGLDQVKPGESYIELKNVERKNVAHAEIAANVGKRNTRFSCDNTPNGTKCHQGHLGTH